jgi:hypothetical protein
VFLIQLKGVYTSLALVYSTSTTLLQKVLRYGVVQMRVNLVSVTMLFWVLTPCIFAGRYHSFTGTYCLHLHDITSFLFDDNIF